MMSEDKEKTMRIKSWTIDIVKPFFYLNAVICVVKGIIPWWFVGFIFFYDIEIKVKVGND